MSKKSKHRPCNECPFMKNTPLAGSPDWLKDIMDRHQKGEYFQHSCHKTDKNADGFVGGKWKECSGHLMIMINKADNAPGRGGVYGSIKELGEKYLRHWLGDEEFEQIKAKAGA